MQHIGDERPRSTGRVPGNFREIGSPMGVDSQFTFGPFRFDARTGELQGDRTEARLTPRAAAVLAMLAGRAQDIVSKQELFDQVWGGLAVSDDALTSCIQELRGALGDDARRPTYIETRHRRGYRLMVPAKLVGECRGDVAATESLARASAIRRSCRPACGAWTLLRPGAGGPASGGVRDRRARHRQEFAGRCIPGFPFSQQRSGSAHGQCLDHHGIGEPYLPLIEALTRLASSAEGATVKEMLAAHAPSWLAQMPSLWSRTERTALGSTWPAPRASACCAN